MPESTTPTPPLPRITPLAPYEPEFRPASGPRWGAGPAPRAASTLAPGQLVLPLHGGAAEDPGTSQTRRDHPSPPGRRELTSLLTALLEAAAGQRSTMRLRALVSDTVLQTLHAQAARGLPGARGADASAARYALGGLHRCLPAASVVEACATAHTRGRAFAVLARVEAEWSGWVCTHFGVVTEPSSHAGSPQVRPAQARPTPT